MTYEYLTIGAAGLSLLLLLLNVWFFLRLKRMDRARQEFFSSDYTDKVEDVVLRHNQGIKELREQLDELGQFVNGLAQANKKNFQKMGFVRFNPFGDTGGAISFVLAVLDAENNGYVISSLHGREGNRVYAKEVSRGVSKSQLTEEEQEAIKQAI